MGQTISEKILSYHSGKSVSSGDIVIAEVDFSFSQDGTSYLVIEKFNSLSKGEPAKKDFFAMVIDNSAPSPNQKISEIHNIMRNFCRSKDLLLYDIGEGVCHQVITESGFVFPGSLVLGA
ncbi:MAG: 3-isopropylmalate dehydratase large subunit, partial [Candidatus Omnitrophota bacterium]